MGSPFRQRSALKHDVLDNNSQSWKHDHTRFGIKGVANVDKPLIADPNYLLNANKANRQVNTSNNNSISAAEQQYNQSEQIANLYNSGRLNPNNFTTEASYRNKIKNKGDLSIKNGNVKFKFPGSTKSIGSWMDNTKNINYNDGEDANLIAPTTQYTTEQINSILGETGMASFVPDGNGGFTFESGGGDNTFSSEEMYRGPKQYFKDEDGVKQESTDFLNALPTGYSLDTSEADERAATMERIKAARLNAGEVARNIIANRDNPPPTPVGNTNAAAITQEILAKRELAKETEKANNAINFKGRAITAAENKSNAPQRVGRAINTRNRYS